MSALGTYGAYGTSAAPLPRGAVRPGRTEGTSNSAILRPTLLSPTYLAIPNSLPPSPLLRHFFASPSLAATRPLNSPEYSTKKYTKPPKTRTEQLPNSYRRIHEALRELSRIWGEAVPAQSRKLCEAEANRKRTESEAEAKNGTVFPKNYVAKPRFLYFFPKEC